MKYSNILASQWGEDSERNNDHCSCQPAKAGERIMQQQISSALFFFVVSHFFPGKWIILQSRTQEN